MEPESTTPPSTNQPAQQPTPVPGMGAAQGAAPIPPEQPATPAQPPEPSPVPQEPAPTAPTAPVPPMPPAGTPAMTTPATAGGSHAALIIGTLLASLLVGGAAAYYYWTTVMDPAVAVQSTDTATSTGSMELADIDPTLRPALEKVIENMNTALAEGNYENFIKTIDAMSGSQIKKEEFGQTKDLLKGLMTIDLTKVSFVDAQQDPVSAGYYFTVPETAADQTYPILTMVRFIKEGGDWKIAKMYSTNIDDPAKVEETIATNENFSFPERTAASQEVDVMVGYDSYSALYTIKINGSVVENINTKNVWGSDAGSATASIPVNKYLKTGENTIEVTLLTSVTRSSFIELVVNMTGKPPVEFKLDLSKKTQSFAFTVPEGTALKPQKSTFDGSFGR